MSRRAWFRGTAHVILLFCLQASAQEPKPPATLPELQQRFSSIIDQPKYVSALWGIKVVSLDTGKTLFEHNPLKLFSPASNSKLYTVALALDRLGPDYTIKTSLYARSRPDADGDLNGDLILYGRGDPTINARIHGDDIFRALEPFVAALTNAGVRRIKGDLVADATYFRGPEYGSGWMWDDLEYSYGAELSALTISDNILSVSISPNTTEGQIANILLSPLTSFVSVSNQVKTAGNVLRVRTFRPLDENLVYVTGEIPLTNRPYVAEVPIHNPAGLFAELLAKALKRGGIKLEGKPRSVQWVAGNAQPLDCARLVELGTVESLPLRTIAAEVMKPSQNLYTDLLLAHVGESTRGKEDRAEETSEDLGIRELNKFLVEASIKRGEVIFEEGSGLSRDNLATPNATITLLRYVQGRPYAKDYIAALPIAGEDGTLRRRMRSTVAAGNVKAKTGTLRWANSLSGFVTTAAGEHLAFSFMLNRFYETGRANSGRVDLDALAVALGGFTGRSGE